MVKKIYIQGNYFIVADPTTGRILEQDFVSDVYITPNFEGQSEYKIAGERFDVFTIAFADIRTKANVPYADQATWETFYQENTGFNSASGGSEAPSNYITINSETDLIESGGKNIIGNYVYRFAASITFTRPFDFSGVNDQCIMIFRGVNFYNGTGAFFQGAYSGSLEISDVGIINTSSQPLFDISGSGVSPINLFVVRRASFLNFSKSGTIKDLGGGIIFGLVQNFDSGGGLIIKDCGLFDADYSVVNSSSNNNPQIVLDNILGDVRLSAGRMSMNSGESYLQISKGISISKAIVSGIPYNSVGEFLATAKIGAISVFADNGSGGTTITSAGHGLTIEQEVSISGTTNYNADFVLDNITTNTFDIDSIFVGNDAVGSFTTGDSNDFLDSNEFEFSNNGDQKDSNEIGKMEIVIPITVTIGVAGTPVEVQGTTGDWSPITTRRFEFEPDGSGRMRYVGLKTRSLHITGNLNMRVSSGNAKLMSGYIMKNGVVINDSKFGQTSNREVGFAPGTTIELITNDFLSLAVSNEDDTVSLVVESGTLSES